MLSAYFIKGQSHKPIRSFFSNSIRQTSTKKSSAIPIFGKRTCKGLEDDSRCPVRDTMTEFHDLKPSKTMKSLSDGNRSVRRVQNGDLRMKTRLFWISTLYIYDWFFILYDDTVSITKFIPCQVNWEDEHWCEKPAWKRRHCPSDNKLLSLLKRKTT